MAIEGVARVEKVVRSLRFNEHGSISVIVQDWRSGTIMMMSWMNSEAIRRTAEDGMAWFWSRSRKRLWRKGEEEGMCQWVRGFTVDKDKDTILLQVEELPDHCIPDITGCFFYHIGSSGPVMIGDPVADNVIEMMEF